MELTFDKATGICEFEVTADFNLHLEREDVGTLHFYQRTTPHGEYDYIKNQGYNADDKVIDLDFQALVYPKWIKIKSAVIPTVATISTDGEVREVSYQAKEIEITSNGTTKVTADTGYTALGSVNVKVNVPSEGGGESMKFYDVSQLIASNDFSKIYSVALCGMLVKLTVDNGIIIVSGAAALAEDSSMIDKFIAIGVDLSQKIISHLFVGSVADVISPILSEITEITKEEFYHIPESEA